MIEGSKAVLSPVPVQAPAPEPKKTVSGSSFKEVLQALGNEAKKGEALVERAVHGAGREVSPADLIALQAGIYRWVEVVDLTSKLVDRAAQAVKTVTQSNGG
jgi:hypothetical protein